MTTKIQLRRDTAANWTTANPTLFSGEVGFETDSGKFKIGNGSSVWSALDYFLDSSDLSGYLTASSASTTYLTQTSASTAYLTQASASSTYLTQTSASSNYLNQSSASTTYLTQASASSNYLNQSSASTTYLTQASASTSYVPKSGDSSISGSLSLTQNSRTTSPLTINAIAPLTATITSASYSAGTYTFTATNTFSAGDIVTITGCIPENFNLFKVTIATATASQFTVTLNQSSTAATSTTTGGTATRQDASLLKLQNSAGAVVASFDQSGILSTASTLLASVTTSAAPIVHFTNLFTTDYSWYRCIFVGTQQTVAVNLTGQFVSGTTLVNTNYIQVTQTTGGVVPTNTTAPTVTISNLAGFDIFQGGSSSVGNYKSVIDIYNPKQTSPTGFDVRSFGGVNSFAYRDISGVQATNTSFDSFAISMTSGGVTGTFKIYGMR